MSVVSFREPQYLNCCRNSYKHEMECGFLSFPRGVFELSISIGYCAA